MLKTRIKRQADQGERARKRLAQIEASIISLNDEDLLDLADIFKTQAGTPLVETAAAEMQRRNIRL
ncbi:hypothetical protein ACLN6N_17870 (plasmid) [Sphingomonas carotinifaciens]|uniref:hypothetical protein n=1 Tax=Sphingomonas TaxID=13687 RepID=UPI000DD7D2BA|nr:MULTISPECIES: hypothetical protein [Sphingomonas]